MKLIARQVFLASLCLATQAYGESAASAKGTPAFTVGGKATTMEDIAKTDQASLYEIEMKKYELIERMAQEKALDAFWQKKATEGKTSVEAARQKYIEKHVDVSKKEFKEAIEKYKNHPQLKNLPKEDLEKQVRDYLKQKGAQELFAKIIEDEKKKGNLIVSYPRPVEPVYDVAITDKDVVRFGPGNDDIKPAGCDAKSCPVKIVEYSEFQCPFCSRVIPSTKKILSEYKGKIVWTVRDFPLSFHDRAKPAAVAAKCAAEQGKYWHMYAELFNDQQALSDADFEKHAAKIGVQDKEKFKKCLAQPGDKLAQIELNTETGMKLGVNGTPAFFINGRKLSGALPYAEFKRVIDEELKKSKK